MSKSFHQLRKVIVESIKNNPDKWHSDNQFDNDNHWLANREMGIRLKIEWDFPLTHVSIQTVEDKMIKKGFIVDDESKKLKFGALDSFLIRIRWNKLRFRRWIYKRHLDSLIKSDDERAEKILFDIMKK